jgi:hypothetical protein
MSKSKTTFDWRLGRIFRGLLRAMLLTLGLACGACWYRSYGHVNEYWFAESSATRHEVTRGFIRSGAGRIGMMRTRIINSEIHETTRETEFKSRAIQDADWQAMGFKFQEAKAPWSYLGIDYATGDMINEARVGISMPYRRIVVPYWLLTSIPAVIWTVWMTARIRKRRRTRVGMCKYCGYDLRASPERCPECGRSSQSPNGLA